MRKEVLLAIFFGLILGFVITFGIYRTQQALLPDTPDDQQTAALRTPATATEPGEQELAIHSPENGLVTDQDHIVVTGSTVADLPIVVLANTTEYITNSDASGSFSVDVPLQVGSTVIATYVLKEDGSSLADQRTIIRGDFTELLAASDSAVAQ